MSTHNKYMIGREREREIHIYIYVYVFNPYCAYIYIKYGEIWEIWGCTTVPRPTTRTPNRIYPTSNHNHTGCWYRTMAPCAPCIQLREYWNIQRIITSNGLFVRRFGSLFFNTVWCFSGKRRYKCVNHFHFSALSRTCYWARRCWFERTLLKFL